MKIAFFELPKEDQNIIAAYLSDISGIEPTFFEEKLSSENTALAENVEIISVFINSMVGKEIIDSLPALKLITTRSTGFDHIDIEYAKSKNITVAYVPNYGSETVAEFTFALLLALNRKIFDAFHQLRETTDYDISKLKGFELKDRTLGVIGTGRIGKNVIRIAKGFQMNVLAYDTMPDTKYAEEAGFSYVALPELFSKSDIISLHVPYNKETHHMINRDAIKIFKKGVYLINTARGEVVDTDALIEGLNNQTVAGAALDVLEGERELREEMELFAERADKSKDFKAIVQDHVLIDMKQVIVTPHIAFFTEEAKNEILKTTCENIRGFISSNPQNIVK